MISKDMTNILPSIRKEGLAVVQHMLYSGRYSRTKLRKLGLLHDPWKNKDKRYKTK